MWQGAHTIRLPASGERQQQTCRPPRMGVTPHAQAAKIKWLFEALPAPQHGFISTKHVCGSSAAFNPQLENFLTNHCVNCCLMPGTKSAIHSRLSTIFVSLPFDLHPPAAPSNAAACSLCCRSCCWPRPAGHWCHRKCLLGALMMPLLESGELQQWQCARMLDSQTAC